MLNIDDMDVDLADDFPARPPNWDAVERALRDARGASLDGCHKIYVLMDDGQFEVEKTLGHEALIELDGTEQNRTEALTTIREWFENSCGLRFVDSVRTNEADPNEGFETLIPQGH